MTATAFKDDDPSEPVEASWTSDQFNVTGAVVGAGGEVCTFSAPDPTSGTVETCERTGGGPPNLDGSAGVWSAVETFSESIFYTVTTEMPIPYQLLFVGLTIGSVHRVVARDRL